MKLTPELKADIDAQDYETLLRKWRFAQVGDQMFQGESGEYYAEAMAKKKAEDPEGAVRASKRVGWEK